MKITDQDFHVKIFGAKISEFGGSRFIPAEVREKTQMVADTKFKHCGWVRQNDARSKFWKATQPADWGKEPEVHIMPTLALIAARHLSVCACRSDLRWCASVLPASTLCAADGICTARLPCLARRVRLVCSADTSLVCVGRTGAGARAGCHQRRVRPMGRPLSRPRPGRRRCRGPRSPRRPRRRCLCRGRRRHGER